MSCDSITLSPNFLIYKMVLRAATPEGDKPNPSSLTPPETSRAVYRIGRREVHQQRPAQLSNSPEGRTPQGTRSLPPLLHSTSPPPPLRIFSSSWDLCALCSVDHCHLIFRPLWSPPYSLWVQHLSGVRSGLVGLHVKMTYFFLMHNHAIGWGDD